MRQKKGATTKDGKIDIGRSYEKTADNSRALKRRI